MSACFNKKEASRQTYLPFVVSGGHCSEEEANWPKTVFGKVNLIVGGVEVCSGQKFALKKEQDC